MPYQPHSSGYLTGGGRYQRRPRRNVARGRRLAHMPDVHLSDIPRIKREVWDFDPALEFEYSQRELMLIAEKILLLDPKPGDEHPVWLNARQLLSRSKREIYINAGVPDPSIASGLYWRVHPEGRHVNSDEQRKRNSASFYR